MHSNCDCASCQEAKLMSDLGHEVYQHIISCQVCCPIATEKSKLGMNFYQVGPYFCTVGQMLTIELENQDKLREKNVQSCQSQ